MIYNYYGNHANEFCHEGIWKGRIQISHSILFQILTISVV